MNAPDREIGKDDPLAQKHSGPKELPTRLARQAVAPGRVRYVLGISLLLVVIAFSIIYFTGVP